MDTTYLYLYTLMSLLILMGGCAWGVVLWGTHMDKRTLHMGTTMGTHTPTPECGHMYTPVCAPRTHPTH